MKNMMYVLLLCLATATISAQESFSAGPVIGANFAKISGTEGEGSDTEFKTGLVAGGQLTYSNVNKWGVGAAILFSQEGVDIINGGLTTEVDLTYLRLPLKGFLFFRDNEDNFRPKVFAGPSIGILLGSETEIEGTDVEVNTKDLYNTLDLGLMVGTGFNVRITQGTWLNFDAAYTHGLFDVAEMGDGANRGISLMAGVSFGF